MDKGRELQIAILKDKEKNPLKYNFLKLKNLTEEQIFRDYRDFELDFDPKGLGNEYLRESKLNSKSKHKHDNKMKTTGENDPTTESKNMSSVNEVNSN